MLQSSAPLDLVAIRTTQAPTNVSDSALTRLIGKESLASLSTPHSKGEVKAHPIRSSTPPNNSQPTALVPITGEALERIKALQPRLDALKGSCVAREMVTEH
jgi:hypothetical protein